MTVDSSPEVASVPQFIDDNFAYLFAADEGFSDAEIKEQFGATFEQLSAEVAKGPSEEEAVVAIKALLLEVKASGFIEQAMQMAMTLGAMACTHNHMQGLANEVGSMFDDAFSSHGKDDEHNHVSEKDSHDAKSCADCKAGRACRKK